MGIEQAMKLLILKQKGVTKIPCKLKTHDLDKLYGLLDDSERRVVADYYRTYRSLHNFDSGEIELDTVDQFIRYIGKGYTSWRYILIEDPVEVPKLHIGLMLETWRALVDISRKHYETIAHLLEEYIESRVIRVAEMDEEWQSAPTFSEIRKWVEQNGVTLSVGIDLFRRTANENWDSLDAPPRMRQVLYRAVTDGVGAPVNYKARRMDIAMFHARIASDGLEWSTDKRVFESNP